MNSRENQFLIQKLEIPLAAANDNLNIFKL